jgi:NADH-quinone oxidoreductase subunit J
LFVAISQIIVYVGGILILIVFGVMLTNRGLLSLPEPHMPGAWSGWLTGIAATILLGGMAVLTDWGSILHARTLPAPTGMTNPELVGTHLLSDWLLPFELAGILLLVALVGAAYVARPSRADQP